MALEIMGKAHALLEMLAESADSDPSRRTDRRDRERADPLVVVRRAWCGDRAFSGRATYRDAQGPVYGPPAPPCSPANKLTDVELDALLDLLHSPEFVDLAPAHGCGRSSWTPERIWRSISTMYGPFASMVRYANGAARPPSGPGPPRAGRSGRHQVWSWDISQLKGPSKGVYYDLYVIIDISAAP